MLYVSYDWQSPSVLKTRWNANIHQWCENQIALKSLFRLVSGFFYNSDPWPSNHLTVCSKPSDPYPWLCDPRFSDTYTHWPQSTTKYNMKWRCDHRSYDCDFSNRKLSPKNVFGASSSLHFYVRSSHNIDKNTIFVLRHDFLDLILRDFILV